MFDEPISTEDLLELQKLVKKQHKRGLQIPVFLFIGLMLLFGVKEYFILTQLHLSIFVEIISFLPKIMMSFLVSCVTYLIYMMLIYQKSYRKFNFNFKNRYIAQTLSHASCLKGLQYSPESGFTFEEVEELGIFPCGRKSMFQSSDFLTGMIDGTAFRCCAVETAKEQPSYSRQSLPQQLFKGQIIEFSSLKQKLFPMGNLQIVPNKAPFSQKPHQDFHKITANHTAFDKQFCIYTDAAHLHSLPADIIEKALAISQTAQDDICLAFVENSVFVAYKQLQNPFDAYLDIPVDEQQSTIIKGAAVIEEIHKILTGFAH